MAFEDQKRSETSKPSQVCVPTEIILEILFRLPVESLLRCKCVCKLWLSLISDPYFINRHAKNNNNESAQRHLRQLLLIIPETPINIQTCHVCDVLHDKALEIDHPFKEVKDIWIVGSCNGLLCLRFCDDHHGTTTYCIWNPSTRRSSKRFSSQPKPYLVDGTGFGYDESTDDYKVVELCCPLNKGTLTAHIYSLKSGNWKHLTHIFQGSLYYDGTFWNGGLHWLVYFDNILNGLSIVVSFDIATETFGKISLPPYDEEDYCLHVKLGDLGGWLCVQGYNLGKNRGDLWVMKKVYGVTSSWIKLFSIQHPAHFRRSPWEAFFKPLCILDDGKVLLQLRSNLVLYDPKNSSLLEIQSVDKYRNAITFVESLVSPDSH